MLLDASSIATALAGLTGWAGSTDGIRRTIETASFPAAIALVVEVAKAAEAADHHPDIDIRWRTLTFTLSTHSEGGVTSKDLEMAAKIDDLFEESLR